MQPIKTTNAMNPAPAKGIESFPTPVIDDVVISEIVNAWKGDYQPLEYGTLWKDVSHAPNQGSFPEHKLVYQQPTSEDGQWVKRIWANDRANQDSYNYAIKYSAGSQEHPIYIRTYVVPRETYGPVKDLTPDPLFPNALLVDEAVQRNEGELDSKYITVTRVYETLPGPEIPTRRYNERGDLETVIVQTVKPNTPPDPDGLLVTGSQVVQEDVSKGVKTTSTVQDHSLLQIKQKKEGLLGETVTTDDIVDPSTSPDPLSQTVVSSTVEQYTATKARKRTTTASGPTSLSSKSKDGKLLGDVTSTESVVAPDSDPDLPSSTIISSEVRQVDSGKAIKRNVVLNNTPTLSGNQKESGLLGIKTTEESIVPAGTPADDLLIESLMVSGDSDIVISSQVEPIDSVRSRKVTVKSSGPVLLSGKENKGGLFGKTQTIESIVPPGSKPDPLTKEVISSQVEPIDRYKSKKTTISIADPTILVGNRLNERGEIESFSQEIVYPGTRASEDSVNISSSEIEPIDGYKSKKTESIVNSRAILSGKESKTGLLGQTLTKSEIVPPGVEADKITWDGSMGVIESIIKPISKGKSEKITVTSTGPSSLNSNSLVDSPIGLVEANIKKSIIKNEEGTISANVKTIKDSINPLDEVKSEREKIEVTDWPTNYGIDYDEVLGIPIFYDETIISPNDYTSKNPAYLTNINIKPLDQWKSLKRTFNKDKISEVLSDQYYRIDVNVPIKLPDKLLDVIAYYGGALGDGGTYDFGGGAFTGSYNRNQSGSTKTSYSINGDIYFSIQKGFDGTVPGYEHIFFMEIKNGKLIGSILNKLNQFAGAGDEQVYEKWPYMQLRSENLLVFSSSISKTESSSLSESVSINGSSQSVGQGKSYETSVNVNSINIPESIHGAIKVHSEVFGPGPGQSGFNNVTYGVRPNALKPTMAVINGIPKSLTSFPTGNYLISSNVELYKWGFVKVTARTVEITAAYV